MKIVLALAVLALTLTGCSRLVTDQAPPPAKVTITSNPVKVERHLVTPHSCKVAFGLAEEGKLGRAYHLLKRDCLRKPD